MGAIRLGKTMAKIAILAEPIGGRPPNRLSKKRYAAVSANGSELLVYSDRRSGGYGNENSNQGQNE